MFHAAQKLRLVDLNFNFGCDWLIEQSDNKLSDNNLSSELKKNNSSLNQSQLRKLQLLKLLGLFIVLSFSKHRFGTLILSLISTEKLFLLLVYGFRLKIYDFSTILL